MNKEELQKELAKAEAEVEALGNLHRNHRESLSRILGFRKQKSRYGCEEEVDIKSWPEIYAAIGRLKCIEDQKKQADRIQNIEIQLNRLIAEEEACQKDNKQ